MSISPKPSLISPSSSTRSRAKPSAGLSKIPSMLHWPLPRWRRPSTPEGRRAAASIHHSDRGVQYASIAYRQKLADLDIAISMSRPGNPFDNAKAESFMKTLKAEEVNGKAFADINDARRRINGFIAEVYNKERLHSALGYQSPLEFKLKRIRAKQQTITHHGNRTVTEITVASSPGVHSRYY